MSEMAPSAKAKSEADWKRCAGLFSRQRCTTRCSAGGRSGAISDMAGGSSFRMADMVSAEVVLWKVRVPASISYKIAPNVKNVGAMVGRLPPHLLGRHVTHGAHDDAELRSGSKGGYIEL